MVWNVELKSSVRLSWTSNEGTDFQCLFYLLARKEKKRKSSVCVFMLVWMRACWPYINHGIPWCTVWFCASFDYLLTNKSWNSIFQISLWMAQKSNNNLVHQWTGRTNRLLHIKRLKDVGKDVKRNSISHILKDSMKIMQPSDELKMPRGPKKPCA